MTDENYVFNQTVKERKTMAIGSRHKVNGSKSKKCTLPHENLTRKELEKMNSEITTIDMNHFYTWDEFLTFSEQSKCDYIEHIIKKYSVSISAISGIVFGNTLLLGRYITDHMLPIQKSIVRGYAAKKGKDALKYDVIEQRYIKEEGTVQMEDNQLHKMTSAQITMDGFDDSVIDFLKEKFKGTNVSVTILVNEVFSFTCGDTGVKGGLK